MYVTVTHVCTKDHSYNILNSIQQDSKRSIMLGDSLSSSSSSSISSPCNKTIIPSLQNKSSEEPEMTVRDHIKPQTIQSSQDIDRKHMKMPTTSKKNDNNGIDYNNLSLGRDTKEHTSQQKLLMVRSSLPRQLQVGSTLFIPIVSLLTTKVARATSPWLFAAASEVEFSVGLISSNPKETCNVMSTLNPVDFKMHTNPVGCASALMNKVTKKLIEWEMILSHGTIITLATKFQRPELGEILYTLLLSTQLFKPRSRNGTILGRDYSTFPNPRTGHTLSLLKRRRRLTIVHKMSNLVLEDHDNQIWVDMLMYHTSHSMLLPHQALITWI